jgi:hypothetical protein
MIRRVGLWALVLTTPFLGCTCRLGDKGLVAPQPASIDPNVGNVNARVPVTITGTNFLEFPRATPGETGGSTLDDSFQASFSSGSNSFALEEVTWVDDEHLTATVPTGVLTAGTTYDLTVVAPNGLSGVLPAAYVATSIAAPSISNVTPGGAVNNAQTTLSITGVGFDPKAKVQLVASNGSGQPVDLSDVPSATQTTTSHQAIVAAGVAAGSYLVQIVNPDTQRGDWPSTCSTSPSSVCFEVVTPAKLSLALSVPSTASTGEMFTITGTVTNNGGSTARNVTLAPVVLQGTGTASVAGMTAPAKIDVPVGSPQVLTVSAMATGHGTLRFTTNAAGVNDFSGQPVTSPSATTPTDLVIQDAASIAVTLVASPSSASLGQDLTLQIQVQNSGEATALGVAPAAVAVSPSGAATPKSGPAPATADIPGGQTQIFTYDFTAAQAGALTFTGGAQGRDANSGTTVSAVQGTSNIVTVGSGATLSITSVTTPASANVGQTFALSVVVMNGGQSAANGVAPSLQAPPQVSLVSGPTPATAPIAGGASATYAYTFAATAAGTVTFTSTASGTDANSGLTVNAPAVSSMPMALVAPGTLQAALSIPAPLSTGQAFTATLIVTNTGGSTVNNVLPSPPQPNVTSVSGNASATTISSPGAANIPGGGSAVYTWAFTATGTGSISMSVNVGGTDANTGASVTASATSNTATVSAPSSLVITAFSIPTTLTRGQTFNASMTVQNTGANAVNNVLPSPNPPMVNATGANASTSTMPAAQNIGSGGSATFSWTYTENGTAPGTLALTGGASGKDAVSGNTVTANPTQTNLAQVLSPPSLSVSSITVPAQVSRGQTFNVSVVVHNGGGATASNVLASPSPPTVTPAGGANATVSGSPAAASIVGGGQASLTYVFQENGTGVGSLVFAAGASGTDANSGAAVTAPQVSSSSVNVVNPATLTVTSLSLPSTLSRGQSFALSMVVSNSGGAKATGVLPAPNPPTSNSSGGPAATTSTTLNPVTINAGANQTFTWIFTENGNGPGTLSFSGGASGTDANSGAAVSAGAVLSNTATVQNAATLAVTSFALAPGTIDRGQMFTATLVVQNTGGASANGVLPVPAPPTPTDTGGAAASTASTVMPQTIAGGGGTATFTWNYVENGSGPGSIALSAGASGTDANSGVALSAPAQSSNTLTVQAPASLVITSFTIPAGLAGSSPFTATMVVKNAGQTTANNVIPSPNPPTVIATGAASASATSTATAQTIAGGALATFSWNYNSGSGDGTITLQAGAGGTDAISGATVTAAATDSNTANVQSSAALISSISIQTAAVAGDDFDVIMNVADSGGANANGVTPSALTTTTSGTVNPSLVSSPAAANISAGANMNFVYSYTTQATDNGTVAFTGNASGTDATSGKPISSASSSSPAMTVVAPPGGLTASLRVLPLTAVVGDQVTVEMVVTNTSGGTLSNVTPTGLDLSGSGQINAVSGPTPSSVASLSVNAQTTFVWTYEAQGFGWVRFAGTATATSPTTAARRASSLALAIRAPWCVVGSLAVSAGSNVSSACGTPMAIGGAPTASGGITPYAYDWTPATGLSSSTAANPTVTPDVASRVYTVTAVDADGCQLSSATTFTATNAPTSTGITSGQGDDRRCTPACGGNCSTFNFNSNCTGCASSSWVFGDGNTSNVGAPSHAYANPGNYEVMFTGTAGNGCHVYVNLPVFVGVFSGSGANTPVGRLASNLGAPPAPFLSASAASVPADGVSTITFQSAALANCNGAAAGAGSAMRFTVMTDRGTITNADVDPSTPGIQVNQSAVAGGFGVSFTVRADTVGGPVHVYALAEDAGGQAEGWGTATFTGSTSLPEVTEFFPEGSTTTNPTSLGAGFNKVMNPSTITSSNVVVQTVGTGTCAAPAGSAISGTVSYLSPTQAALFVPPTLNVASNAYAVQMTSAVQDNNGNPLDGAFNGMAGNFTFCFGNVPDTTPPTATCTSVTPGTISPDGDGVNDTATIAVNVSDNVQLYGWRAVVRPTNGVAPVRSLFKLQGANGPDTTIWDGHGATGSVVPNGNYNISVTAIDASFNVSATCDLTVGVQSVFDPSLLSPP